MERERAETEFDALMDFRKLNSDTERLEALFMGGREATRIAQRVDARLDLLNGTARETKGSLENHLAEHKNQQSGIDFIKRWGARGTGLIVVALAIGQIVNIIVTLTQ